MGQRRPHKFTFKQADLPKLHDAATFEFEGSEWHCECCGTARGDDSDYIITYEVLPPMMPDVGSQ